jgi:hypothetical protein
MRGRKTNGKVNICVDCKNAYGGCSWSEINPETGRVRFQPVPGWTAVKSCIGREKAHGKIRVIETYQISACPEFVRG